MAQIVAATNEKVFPIKAFKGLHQNPDGDTKLKMGEAAVMKNWRITRDGNLQRRPGTLTKVDLNTSNPVKGLWVGFVSGHEYMIGACNGKLYYFWKDTSANFAATQIGSVNTDGAVHVFGFNGIVYILDGVKYRQWDGTTYKEVEGYVPLVYIAIPPTNSQDESSVLENVNRLTGKRRVWLSPDGTGKTFQLPEKNLASVDYAVLTSDGSTSVAYTSNLTNGTVTFTNTPAQAVNSIEVGYTVGTAFRSQVEHMHYAELYAGQQDTRVFLYGDGSNKCIYSGIDYNGNPRADYFPDLYECKVGDENTPITGMIRHFSALVCYKSNSAWSIQATQLGLADGLTIPAFYVAPVNRTIGNAAPGQVQLVLNSPFALFGDDLYEWKNSSYYTSNLTSDERQAKRISDRVWSTLAGFYAPACICYDHNEAQEYYICYTSRALVYNYAADAWYLYENFSASSLVSLHGTLYIGTPDGKLKEVDETILSDDGTVIDAYWESGSMDFGQPYMRKYSAMLWVSIQPEGGSEVSVTTMTDRVVDAKVKSVSATFGGSFSFTDLFFGNVDFGVTKIALIKRLKLKSKKFTYFKIIFTNHTLNSRATVLDSEIRVRFTGYAK